MARHALSLLSIICWAVVAAVVPEGGRAQMAGPVADASDGPLSRSTAALGDSLYLAGDLNGAMTLLDERLTSVPDDFDALWRETRAALTLGILAERRDDKVRWLQVASRHADRLMELRPDDRIALAWTAAAKGRLAMEIRHPVAIARLGREVWRVTGVLLTQEPDDPMGNDVRGKLVLELRRMSWGERILARALLGSDVVGAARWSDAESYLERAVESDPGMVLYHLDLGDAYRLQGKSSDALQTYRDGLALPARYPVDEYFKRRIQDGLGALPGRGGSGS